MMIEFIGGIIIGVTIDDWRGRCVLPMVIGLFSCCEIFVMQLRINHLSSKWDKEEMKADGLSEEEIAEGIQMFKQVIPRAMVPWFRNWMIYPWQFFSSTLMTLVVALGSGLIHDWLT